MPPTTACTLAALLLTLAACSSSSAGAPAVAPRPATQTVRTPAGDVTIAPAPRADVVVIAAALPRVWSWLPSVYDSIGVKIETADGALYRIGNQALNVRQRLGRAPLSRFVDCGQSQIGPNADSYQVILTVITQLQAAGPDSTRVTTVVEAQARPITHAQAYSACTTRGALEGRIVQLLRLRVIASAR